MYVIKTNKLYQRKEILFLKRFLRITRPYLLGYASVIHVYCRVHMKIILDYRINRSV